MISIINLGIQQGWECPRCHTINAPWLSQCTCKLEVKEEYNHDAVEAIPKCQSDSDHKWELIGTSSNGDTYQCSKCGTMRQYLHDGSVMKV